MADPTLSVLQLLQQAGQVHEAQLNAAEERLKEATVELQQLRLSLAPSAPSDAAGADGTPMSPTTRRELEAPRPPTSPPKLTVQVGDRGAKRLGSRVSFSYDENGGDSPDRSPRGHAETMNSQNTEGDHPEDSGIVGDPSPRAWSTPLPLPGLVPPDGGPRRASVDGGTVPFSAVMPGENNEGQNSAGPGLPRALSRITGDTEMMRFREELPPDLKLAAAWRKKTSGTTSKVGRTVSSKAHMHMDTEEEELLLLRVLDRMVLDPSSAKRMAFEVFGLVLIIYDLFWLPMQVFDPPVSTFTEVMGWTSSIYWLVDIPMSFLVGNIRKGIMEIKVRTIAGIYLRGWFWFDILVVSVDWVLNILEVVNNTKNVGGISALRLGKGVRVLRVFRLIRVLKGGGILQELLDTIHSEHCIIIVGIVKLLGLILCVNHIIACLWFWAGSSGYEVTWITEADIMQRSLAYKYATCLHWSLTQFTPASMEVYPTNEEERIFCVCVIVSAMVIFSSFISAITNAMTQLRNLNREKIEQFSLLRKYLTQCNVSGGLLARVLQSVSSALNKNKRRVHEEDIKVLHLLPLSLRQDINQEVYSPYFVAHPFFSVCSSCFDAYVRKLYSSGVKGKFLPANQELITSGEQAKEMLFVISGTVNYKADRQVSPLPVPMVEGTWLSEACLWIHWSHNGIGTTAQECDVLALDASKFQDVFKDDVTVKHYAVAFWSHFMANPMHLTDIWSDEEFLYQWSTEALLTAEQCVGSAIQPDQRNSEFFRHVATKRRSSSAMLDQTLLGKDFFSSAAELGLDSP